MNRPGAPRATPRPHRYVDPLTGKIGIVFGEADDSPGLQLLGGALVVGAVAFGVRIARRGR